MTSNILHQALSEEVNIIYGPSNSIFDQILYLTDNNFFIFSDIKSVSDNCKCISQEYVDLYQYDMLCSNSVMDHKNNNNLASVMHVHPVVIEHRGRDPRLKKEDLFILKQQLTNHKKIFFNRDVSKSWDFNSGLNIMDYGIPTHMFKPMSEIDKKDVLISSQSNILANQVAQYLTQNAKLQCDIVTTFADKNIEEINQTLNSYKIFIDLNNNTVDTLCAASCGLKTILLANNIIDMKLDSVGTKFARSLEEVIGIAINIQNNVIDNIDTVRNYIDQNYGFENFKTTINNTFDIIKRKACIL